MGGRTWARTRRPHRMRATYNRRHGIEYFLGFYDVHADCLSGYFVKRKRVIDLAAAFRRLRACYPRRRLYVVLDNLPHVHDHPRFLADNIQRNAQLLAPLEKIAAARKCTPAQVALAWVLAQGEDIVPIPGTKRRPYLEQNAASLEVKLTGEEIAALAQAFPLNVTAGTRYPEKQLKALGI